MENKEQLTTLIRIACAFKVQRQFTKAKEAYEKALKFWAASGLDVTDWEEADSEYQTAHHYHAAGLRDYAYLEA